MSVCGWCHIPVPAGSKYCSVQHRHISNPGSTRVPPETPEDLKDASAEGCAEPEPNDPSGADSATTGSASREGFGRLVGEQLAYAWFEAVVARGEEP